MSHPQNKKQRLVVGTDADDTAVETSMSISFSSLSVDIISNIFGHLPLEEIMRSRRVCKKTNEAVKETEVPLGGRSTNTYTLDSIEKYNALIVMAEALPGLQQICIDSQSYDSKYKKKEGEFKYIDGEIPNEEVAASTAGYVTLDIVDALSNSKFPKLHALTISRGAPLNGRYPSLFNFSHLEKLTIDCCANIKFELEMLAGLPSLKEFKCVRNNLVGTLKSLGVCKDTLESIKLADGNVPGTISGNFMDLANFPRLRSLDLYNTVGIRGSLCDIDGDNDNHFPMLESLLLPSTVVGGLRYEVMRVADAKQLIKDLTPLRRKRPALFNHALFKKLYWKLSSESPDVIDPRGDPEFDFRNYTFYFVQSGSYLGWRWEQSFDYTPDHPFEVHWLDPPSSDVAKRFIPSGTGRFYKGEYFFRH